MFLSKMASKDEHESPANFQSQLQENRYIRR